MTEQLEKAIQHIKTRADAWAVKEVTEALQSISERLDKALTQEPCDDTVSREDVLAEITRFSTEEGASVECQQLYCDVNNMPSVTQTSGKWIDRDSKTYYPFWERYMCSECGTNGDNSNKYCPNCGAKMESEEV